MWLLMFMNYGWVEKKIEEEDTMKIDEGRQK